MIKNVSVESDPIENVFLDIKDLKLDDPSSSSGSSEETVNKATNKVNITEEQILKRFGIPPRKTTGILQPQPSWRWHVAFMNLNDEYRFDIMKQIDNVSLNLVDRSLDIYVRQATTGIPIEAISAICGSHGGHQKYKGNILINFMDGGNNIPLSSMNLDCQIISHELKLRYNSNSYMTHHLKFEITAMTNLDIL